MDYWYDLQEYLKTTELRVVNPQFHVRLSPEMAIKYDNSDYAECIALHESCINELLALGIKLPENKNPVFYLYMVPDENFAELIHYPYKNHITGGKGVACYDADGFNKAYASSQNLFCGKYAERSDNITRAKLLHEWSHVLIAQFNPDEWALARAFSEGLAELIPWYVLDYESKCPEHTDAILQNDIYPAIHLLGLDENDVFNDMIKGKQASFQKSYVSSYLIMRAILENIEYNFHVTKVQALQQLLELLNTNRNSFLLLQDLAEYTKIDYKTLRSKTDYQNSVLQKIKNTQ